MNSLCLHGEIMRADQPVLMADNRGFRYGEGVFETMKVVSGKIPLQAYHLERLFSGLDLLQLKTPSKLSGEILINQVLNLCELNHCSGLARVRLTFFAGNGMINKENNISQYLVETSVPDKTTNQFNKKGFVIGLYKEAKKTCDKFSNLKSANYLPYLMAAKYSRNNGLDESLVLNTYDRIAEGTNANLFLIKEEQIITPSLAEGCVNGVMRRFLVNQLTDAGYNIVQQPVNEQDIENADELFLTNAMYGIRWVHQYRDKEYGKTMAEKIYDQFIQPIWQ